MQNEIRVPQGMRDLMSSECEKKEVLKKRIEKIFTDAGYQEIETPEIEFFTTFKNAYADVKSEEMYRFFDQNGKMLVLREDMTVPAARVCASKFAGALPPFRIRYCADVFKVRHAFGGKRNEVTDCGIELIGMDETGDLEVIVTAVDVMNCLEAGQWVLEIGNSRFFKEACRYIHINDEQERILADLTDRKSIPDLTAFLDSLHLTKRERTFFLRLPLLGGNDEVLKEAYSLSFNEILQQEVNKLMDLQEKLERIGYADHITYDFGKIPHLDYYTGILMEGYVEKSGTSVLSGGRYDHLLEKFGRALPACGFSIKLDYLLDSVKYAPSEKTRKLYYPRGKETDAILLAKKLREKYPVELCVWDKSEMEVKE